MKTTLQNAVLSYLRKGHKLTALSAFREFGTLRLSSVICVLRKAGHRITSEQVKHKTKRYGTVMIARYKYGK